MFTRGVITEERFQKMTDTQWIWQYLIAKEAEDLELDKLKVILDHLKLVGSMANPKLGKELAEMEEVQKAKEELSEDNFDELYNDENIPDTIQIKIPRDKDIISLPKYNRRSPGIKKGGD